MPTPEGTYPLEFLLTISAACIHRAFTMLPVYLWDGVSAVAIKTESWMVIRTVKRVFIVQAVCN